MSILAFGTDGIATAVYPHEVASLTTPNGARSLAVLPLMVEAAREANEQGYCHVYDQIADAIGTWTRDELAEGGFLDRDYTVTGTRRVTVTLEIPFSVSVTASSADNARDLDLSDYVDNEVDGYTLRDAVSTYATYSVDDDGDWDVDSVEAD